MADVDTFMENLNEIESAMATSLCLHCVVAYFMTSAVDYCLDVIRTRMRV
jgi:hypothetical protein